LIHKVPTAPLLPSLPEDVGELVVQYEHVFAVVLPSPFRPVQNPTESGVTPALIKETETPEDQRVGQLAASWTYEVDITGAVVGKGTPTIGTMGLEIVHPFVAATGHVYVHCIETAVGEELGHALRT
jgi:hypothetical protein